MRSGQRNGWVVSKPCSRVERGWMLWCWCCCFGVELAAAQIQVAKQWDLAHEKASAFPCCLQCRRCSEYSTAFVLLLPLVAGCPRGRPRGRLLAPTRSVDEPMQYHLGGTGSVGLTLPSFLRHPKKCNGGVIGFHDVHASCQAHCRPTVQWSWTKALQNR